jgi:hypothetical protein
MILTIDNPYLTLTDIFKNWKMNNSYVNQIELLNSSIARLENQMEKLENSSGMTQSFLEQFNWYYQPCVRHINSYNNSLQNLQRIVDETPAETSVANSE